MKIIVTATGDVTNPNDHGGHPDHYTDAGEETSYLVTLTGSDGTVWDLNHGPVTLSPGVKLFDLPPLTHWLKTSPGVAGSRWTGVQVEEQSYTLPVTTRGQTWDDWRDTDNAFFSGITPTSEFTLTVTAPDSVTRSTRCRLVSPGDITDDMDPLIGCARDYQLALVAPNPFWRGPVVSKTVTFGDVLDLFPGPPFHINSSTRVETATISNPGDVPAWPRYTIGGPAASWEVGVGDSVVSSSTVPTGSNHIHIDSSPGVRTIVDGAGNRQYANMDAISFAPIPPGSEVTIVATMTGFAPTSTIVVELEPQYWRPL